MPDNTYKTIFPIVAFIFGLKTQIQPHCTLLPLTS